MEEEMVRRDDRSDHANRQETRYNREQNRRQRRPGGGVKRERDTRCAGRLVVAVMQIDAALLGVRDDTRLVARKRKRRARPADLTDSCQQSCKQPKAPHHASRGRKANIHLDLS
jgi:hypothetical protein